MLNYYQTDLGPFLGKESHQVPSGVAFRYYFSFEDGLWDLIQNKFPAGKKVQFLVPDFYCSDVLDNIRGHGYDYSYYQLDDNFQISAAKFKEYLWLYKPDVVILFHAGGISCQLFQDTSWIKDEVIIEDCVHRLVDPGHLKLVSKKHVVMDSLRKVSPLPGSRMYGHKDFLNYPPAKYSLLSVYGLSARGLFWLFRTIFLIGVKVNSGRIVTFVHKWILEWHDNIVGNNKTGLGGIKSVIRLIERFDYSKIEAMKERQVKKYEAELSGLFTSRGFFKIKFESDDWGRLRAYPIGVKNDLIERVTRLLEENHLTIWFQFTDSPWAQKRGVVFLPLGFHVKDREINWVCQKLLSLNKFTEIVGTPRR